MTWKQSVKVSFVTSGIEKMRKKVDDFLFLPLLNFRSSLSFAIKYPATNMKEHNNKQNIFINQISNICPVQEKQCSAARLILIFRKAMQ